MTRAHEPIHPCGFVNESDRNASAPDGTVVAPGGLHAMTGMTLREYYAGLAMQGLLARSDPTPYSLIAQWAVQDADALLAALAKVRP
jgi:hypothetical protein